MISDFGASCGKGPMGQSPVGRFSLFHSYIRSQRRFCIELFSCKFKIFRVTYACFLKSRENPHMLDPLTKTFSALQNDAQLTAQQLGEMLNLSTSQAGRRRQRLEAEGYILGYAARLDPTKLGFMFKAFVQVHLGTHGTSRPASITVW